MVPPSTPPPTPPPTPPLQPPPSPLHPFALPAGANAWYRMGEFDLTARLWPDASGSGNAATLSGDGFSRVRESGNGSPWFVTALQGGTSSVIRFGPGRIIESEFTICSVTRYTGGLKRRILDGGEENWLHGHHTGHVGVAHYSGWKTSPQGLNDSPDTDWVVMCGTNAGSQLS